MIDDTIVAPATTPGTGAISIVRLSGPEVFSIVDAVVQLKHGSVSEAEGYTIHYGMVYTEIPSALPGLGMTKNVIPSEASVSPALLDEVLVSVFRAPHSYTGEDAVEISCHASSFIVSELIQRLLSAGARFAQPGEFTRRAFLNGKLDLAQAETVADVISSTTAASHRVAMNQLKGSVSTELDALREQLLEMASLLELELDFSEEDVEFADRAKLLSLMQEAKRHTDRLAASFRQGNLIKNGVPVAIIGGVNSGKSTLLNALLGEDRAIVSDIPGTTRDTIEECLNIGGILFRFIDTAGIRESSDEVERIGINRTFRKLSEAEIVLGMLDMSRSELELKDDLDIVLSRVVWHCQKLILVLNKTDLQDNPVVNKNVISINNYVSTAKAKIVSVEISAKQGKGLDALKNALYQAEEGLIPNADSAFITNTRHLEALKNASSALAVCIASLSGGMPSELVAADLRCAIYYINSILGQDLGLDADVVLNRIFQSHCIGK